MLTLKLEYAFRRTYTWALLLTASIALVTYFVHTRTADIQNIALRQVDSSLVVRTNMHSIAFLANRLVITSKDAERDSIRHEVQQNIDLMLSTYKQLLTEADATQNSVIHVVIPGNLTQRINAYLDSARDLISADMVTTSSDAYQRIVTMRSEMLDSINNLAEHFRTESQTLVQQHERIELVLIVLMLLTLGLEGAFIFRPMERYIQTVQHNLRAEVERSRAAATALSHSEARYRQMFENNPAVKLIINPPDGRIVEANRAASTFYGYPLDTLKTMTVIDINAMPLSFINATMNEVLITPNAVIQGKHRLASGEIRFVEISAGPLSLSNSPLIYAIVQDVTNRKQAEDALHESEIRFRALFEQNSDGIFILDLDGKLLAINQSALDMLGYTKDEIEQFPIPQLSAETADSQRVFQQLAADERLPIYERIFRKKNGQLFPVEINAKLVRASNGDPLHIQSIVRDISQRKQAEQALRESEKLYRTLVENMPGASVFMFDTNMRYTLAEGRYLRQGLGQSGDALIGKTPRQVLSGESADFIVAINERILRGESFSYERISDELGYQAFATPLYDEAGLITGGMIMSHDISELLRTQQALRTQEQRLRLITDNIQDVVTQTDADNVITFASPSYFAVLGYEPASLLGKIGNSLVYSDDFAAYSNHLRAAIASSDHRLNLEGRLVHRDGHIIWTETVGKLLFNDHGHHSGAVYVTREITERKRLEQALIEQEKLRTALEKEQELSTLKTRMMEVIAHEFRTPLAVIQLTMGTLTDYFDRITPEQRVTKFHTIMDRIQRVTDMLNELDIIVRGGFMPQWVQRKLVDFAAMCRKSATDLELEYNLNSKFDLELETPAPLYADPSILENAIKHILSNAVRFSASTGVVKVSIVTRDNGFELRVADTGIGIPENEQARLFQPFFRGSNIGAIGGLGLGLTIARAAVEVHQGTISVESTVGNGTTVKLWLPVGPHSASQ